MRGSRLGRVGFQTRRVWSEQAPTTRSWSDRTSRVRWVNGLPPWLSRGRKALLTARDPREFLNGRQELTVDVPDVVDGTDCHVQATADDDRLLLTAGAEGAETGRTGGRKTLRNLGAGRYDTHLTLPGPGTWRVTVGDPVNAGRVHEVSSVVPAAQP
ncbi:hypothetical protein [Streptomyces sp. KR55]|uniref:hypothetical protein n=1 Tax=Streptomyces sp. KR55 TaxID=3457425 RepID=UPI003FD2E9BF